MNSTATSDPAVQSATGRLHLVRGVVALVWAGLLAVASTSSGSFALGESLPWFVVGLLVSYPLIDVAASVIDARLGTHTAPRNATTQWINAAISLVTAVAIAVAAGHGAGAVLRVFGGWALLTGTIQLALGVIRRRRGAPGQLPMILSGGISSVAGLAFIVMAAQADVNLSILAGYAAAGAVFFLASAWRLRATPDTSPGRTLKKSDSLVR